ncbi:hypothetical protein GFS24_04080 [Chitinophaga sp. SYP-B3965]|uniref:patatin-like phospholipase family protein n=1 Tax=Chitinophaga sp. SYP-B3965 TaxID=2663120 RepID=UPI001299CA66|nr:patatin-like phospholipase family protein [Chitinophaga sp. SYP-B3965]MRG44276.1 hypothetical protein [Chitinophaga sp. SYP-B3965]
MANNPVVILTIDGGGIRGIIPAYVLTQFEKLTGKPCHQLFDIIGGTSTGGILSAGLTTPNTQVSNFIPFTAAALLSIYQTLGSRIFVKQDIGESCADYYADDGKGNGVEVFLQKIIGPTITLSAAQKAVSSIKGNRVQQMFTTGYIVNSKGGTVKDPVQGADYGPVLFNWKDAISNPLACDYRVWEAARATSAAPVYFPVAQVGGGVSPRSNTPEKWVVDGGTMSNNPAIWAFTEAFKLGAQRLSDITIISLGTGVYRGANGVGIHTNAWPDYFDNGNWDSGPWMGDMDDLEGFNADGSLLTIILEAVQQVSNSQLTALVKGGLNYYRLEPVITQCESAMDDITTPNISRLTDRAMSYVQNEGKPVFDKVISILKGL